MWSSGTVEHEGFLAGGGSGQALAGGNIYNRIRSAIGFELTTRRLVVYGDGLLTPTFRERLQTRFGMVKSEQEAGRRYAMEGSVDAITRSMHDATGNR